MSGFENYAQDARDIERALMAHGVALGIDWNNDSAVRALAAESLKAEPGQIHAFIRSTDPRSRAKGEIFALSSLMLKLMTTSAGMGVHTHGGSAWKAFARALYSLSETHARTAGK